MTRNSHVQFGGGPIEKEHLATSLAAYPTKPVVLHNDFVKEQYQAHEVTKEICAQIIRWSAAAVILMHNHPSGDPGPSQEDLHITKRLREIGEVLGVRVLDHLIFGEGRYVSFVDSGYWDK